MKRFLLIVLVGFMTTTAFADQLYLGPSGIFSSDANFAYVTGGVWEAVGFATLFQSRSGPYPPGYTIGGSAWLFLDDRTFLINGVETTFSFPSGQIDMTSVVLPPLGRDFTVPVDVNFSADGISYDTGQTIFLSGSAHGHITFTANTSEGGGWVVGDFMQAPEPGSLGLVVTGLAGVLATARKKIRMW
jgi:hypothetical protein